MVFYPKETFMYIRPEPSLDALTINFFEQVIIFFITTCSLYKPVKVWSFMELDMSCCSTLNFAGLQL